MLPTLQDLLGNLMDIGLIIAIYLTLRLLRYQSPDTIPIDNPKREIKLVVVVALIYILFLFFEFIFLYDIFVVSWLNTFPIYNPYSTGFNMIWISLVSGMDIVLIYVSMRYTKQSWKSVGIQKIDSWKTLMIGFIPIALIMAGFSFYVLSLGARFTNDVWILPRLLYYLIAATSEELVIRGYIQTRLVSYFGPINGLTIASMFFAISHFPVAYLNWGMGNAIETLLFVLLKFTAGLAFGYIYHKTQNIVPGIILHAFYNWMQDLYIFT